MRSSQLHAPTLKENPRDAEVVSHQLLVRGGYIRGVAAGIYNFLPLGHRVLQKVAQIIREEMNRAGAQEVLMPLIQPAELWQESDRWAQYGPEMMRLKDRKGGDFCLGPTHEEVIVDMVRRDVRSWRALPLNLYQIQSKFRDEIRPRAGLLRGREFMMKDAYSFDVNDEAANRTYDAMFSAYEKIFTRCGLDFRPVEADTGAIGGSRSHEFQVLVESGEDAIVGCSACSYAANVEQAELTPAARFDGPEKMLGTVDTPNSKTINEVSAYLGISAEICVKALVLMADDAPVLALLRGDHDLNEIKLKKAAGASVVRFASEAEIRGLLGCAPGECGPVGVEMPIYADASLRDATGLICGAQKPDIHFQGLDMSRDLSDVTYADLRMAQTGDPCGKCGSELVAYRGIEVGHIFFLGTKYSAAMKCHILDETGREVPMVMGCYGIGVSRILAAAVEQHHDASGICWPRSIAPFEVAVLPLQMKREDVRAAAEKLYNELKNRGIDVLIDDRDERVGSKFKDADLLGAPVRIAIGGKGLDQGVAEMRGRKHEASTMVPLDNVVEETLRWLEEAQ
ncbi:MAG: proline--tRNA ligase [Bradymonadia bacterium]